METSFERLLKLGESIALIGNGEEGNPKKKSRRFKERCSDGYFLGTTENLSEEDLKTQCVEIMNEDGMYCCLERWFNEEKTSSKIEDPLLLELISFLISNFH